MALKEEESHSEMGKNSTKIRKSQSQRNINKTKTEPVELSEAEREKLERRKRYLSKLKKEL